MGASGTSPENQDPSCSRRARAPRWLRLLFSDCPTCDVLFWIVLGALMSGLMWAGICFFTRPDCGPSRWPI